jgi:hypothetical protein
MNTPSELYDTDFHGWAQQQAALLRTGQWQALDHDHLAEEIEDLSRRERQALRNRLVVLLVHLLKWPYQPQRRVQGRSWYYTIREQRLAITEILAESPSLRPVGPDLLRSVYLRAQIRAARDTRLPETTFPTHCPWTWEQVRDDHFWPEV